MQREARVALQVARLARLPHRADPQLAVEERGLGAGDARRAVAADRGERLVGVGVQALAHRCGELGGRRLEFGPARHGASGAGRRPRRPARCRKRSSMMRFMADRLRDLIDLVLGSLDEPGADGRALAEPRPLLARPPRPAAGGGDRRVAGRAAPAAAARARGVAAARRGAATAVGGRGRRRLRLARRVLARVRARLRRAAERVRRAAAVELEAPERHPLPPAGRPADPGRARAGRPARPHRAHGAHHLDRVRELLEAAATLPAEALERPLRPGFVVVWFEGEEASAAVMAERLVFTLEVWVAAMAGEPLPGAARGGLLSRLDRAARAFARIARADPRPRRLGRRVRRRALRAAAVVHLRRRARARPQLRRGPPRGARGGAGRARRAPCRLRRPDRVGGRPLTR